MPDPLKIEGIADVLFDRQASSAEWQSACEAFHAACLQHLPPLDERATSLAAGEALAPVDAARCSLDAARTARLVRALDARIAAIAEQHGDVRVLYAGCGPLAPLALLLAQRWRGRGVVFDLVDVHAQSIEATRRLFGLADVAEMLGVLHCADATTLQLDGDAPRPQILVAEVMRRALSREPQVAVVANLLPQCARGAALVPERIVVEAALTRASEYAATPRSAPLYHLGPLLLLSRETVPSLEHCLRQGDTCLPEVLLHVPDDIEGGLDLMLSTRIDAGPGETLADYESGLTTPLFAFDLGRIRPGDTLGFSYRLGRDPGFFIRRIP